MTQHILINSRQYTSNMSIDHELNITQQNNVLCDLSHMGIISIIGEHAQTFLQGQLSCDVTQVNETAMQHGLLANLKGRILTLMDVVLCHDYQLILPKDLIGTTLKSLSKPAMLSRVRLKEASDYETLGLVGTEHPFLAKYGLSLPPQDNNMVINETFCCYRAGSNRYILLLPKSLSTQIKQDCDQSKTLRGSLLWHHLSLLDGQITIYPESRGLFLPHRLELQHKNYLDFNKGCYKGQEVIARMHYRAKHKHGMRHFILDAHDNIKSGHKFMFANTSQEAGHIIDYCPINSNQTLVAASMLLDAQEPFTIEI